MRLLHRLRFRLRRHQAETSLTDEMQLHREMLEERLRREGMTEQAGPGYGRAPLR